MADGSLLFDTKVDSSGFEAGVAKIGAMGKAAGVAVGATAAAIGGLGAGALKASIDFESAFAGVIKTVDATDAQLATLREGIIDMSKEMPASAIEIAAVAEAAGQLGIQTDNILGFTETMIMLGESTNISAEEAATSLARLANITGMSQGDFDRLGSTIVELGNNLATTEGEIVAMGLRLAGTGAQIGLTEHEILALAGAMSSVGINAEAGGSAMSRAMQKINTEVLSGGENLSKFAEISGMSAEEFSAAWKERPTEALTAFVDGLNGINEAGGDVTSTLKDLGLNSLQEIDTLLRLAGASDILKDSLEMAAKAWGDNTALQTEFGARLATTEAQMSMLKNKVTALGIAIGDNLKVGFSEAIVAANGFVDQLIGAFEKGGFEGLATQVGTVLSQMAQQIASAAPQMAQQAHNLMQAFVRGISANMGSLTASAGDIVTALANGFTSTLGMIAEIGVMAITLFAQGLGQGMPQIMEHATQVMESLLQTLIANAPLLIEGGAQAIAGFAQGLAEATPTLLPLVIELVIAIADAIIANLPAIIEAGLQLILALAQGIADALPTLIENAPRLINEFANAIYSMIPTLISVGVQIIIALVMGIIQAIPTLIANIPQIILAIVNAFTLFNWAQIGRNMLTKIGEGIRSMGGSIAAAARSAAQGAKTAIDGAWAPAMTWGRSMATKLGQGISGAASSVRTAAKTVADGAKTAITTAWQAAGTWARDMIQKLAQGISGGQGTLRTAATTLANAVKTAITTIWNQAGTWAKQLAQKLAQGITGAAGSVKTAASTLANNAKTAITSAWANAAALGREFVSKIASGISGAVGTVVSAARQAIQSAIDAARGAAAQAASIGGDMVRGIASGIAGAGSAIASALWGSVQSAISWVKGRLGIASPSKLMRDEIGHWIPAGVGEGIDGNTKAVTSAIGRMAEAAIGILEAALGLSLGASDIFGAMGQKIPGNIADGMRKDQNSILDAANDAAYALLVQMTNDMEDLNYFERRSMLEHLDEMRDLRLVEIDAAYRAYADMQLARIEETGAEIAALEEQIEQERKAKVSDARIAELEADKEMLENRKENYEKYNQDFVDLYSGVVEEYKSAIDGVIGKQDELADKMRTYGDVLEQVRDSEGNVVKDKMGNDMYKLASLDEQIMRITSYSTLLEDLERRGADVDVMATMLSMSVEDAVRYGELLMQQSDADWNQYMHLMEVKRNKSNEIAQKYYKDELDALRNEYTSVLQDDLTALVDASGEVGIDSATALADGFIANSYQFTDAVQQTVDDVIADAASKAAYGAEQIRAEMEAVVAEFNVQTTAAQQRAEQARQESYQASQVNNSATINQEINVYGDGDRDAGRQIADDASRELKRVGVVPV